MNERLAQSVRRLIDATIRTEVDVATLAAVQSKIDWATEQLSASLMPGSFGVQQTVRRPEHGIGQRRYRPSAIRSRLPWSFADDADGAVHADFVLGAAYEGPPGTSTAVSAR